MQGPSSSQIGQTRSYSSHEKGGPKAAAVIDFRINY